LNATKDPKMINCLIFLTKPFDNIKEIRQAIGNSFTEITLKRLTLSYDLIKDPLEDWHYLFCEMYDIDPNVLGWRVRFQLNKSALYEYNVSMRLIKERIESNFPEMTVLYTPESLGIIDIFMEDCRLDNEEENDEESDLEDEDYEEEEDETIDNPEEDEGEDDLIEKPIEKSIEKPKKLKQVEIKIEGNQIPKDMEQIINIEDKIIPMVMKTQLSGITNVKEIFFEKRKPDEKDKPDEWVVTTEGSNLYGLFSHPLVDKKRTLCNNMWEIYEVFGIESARQFLIEEFMDVVTSDGTFVNSSHVELLVDLMTYTGSIISISRYGQKKVGSGPLSKASFEESLENFLKAGLNGEKETTDGVSASIILGKLPKTGTGVFDIKIDTDKLIKNHTMLKKEEMKEERKEDMKHERKVEMKEEMKEEKKEEKKEEIISIKSKKMKKVNSLCI
jgi:DNA-directed RNA polymerase II subunit RPB1